MDRRDDRVFEDVRHSRSAEDSAREPLTRQWTKERIGYADF